MLWDDLTRVWGVDASALDFISIGALTNQSLQEYVFNLDDLYWFRYRHLIASYRKAFPQ